MTMKRPCWLAGRPDTNRWSDGTLNLISADVLDGFLRVRKTQAKGSTPLTAPFLGKVPRGRKPHVDPTESLREMPARLNVKEERCWCGHLQRWHHWTGICRRCAKMELRRPQFNFMPRHAFAPEIPEELVHRTANAIGRLMRARSGRGIFGAD